MLDDCLAVILCSNKVSDVTQHTVLSVRKKIYRSPGFDYHRLYTCAHHTLHKNQTNVDCWALTWFCSLPPSRQTFKSALTLILLSVVDVLTTLVAKPWNQLVTNWYPNCGSQLETNSETCSTENSGVYINSLRAKSLFFHSLYTFILNLAFLQKILYIHMAINFRTSEYHQNQIQLYTNL